MTDEWFDAEFKQYRQEQVQIDDDLLIEVEPDNDEVIIECTCEIDKDTCLVHNPELNDIY